MSNRLLDDWVQKVEVVNHKKIAGATTLAIMSDGWSCVSGDSHIQFLVSTPEPIFVKSVAYTRRRSLTPLSSYSMKYAT
jgi:hypothetical protein